MWSLQTSHRRRQINKKKLEKFYAGILLTFHWIAKKLAYLDPVCKKMWFFFLGWRRSRVKSQHQRYELSLHASTVDKRKIISKQADALLFNQFVLITNDICLLSMSTVEARPLKKEQKPLILWHWREQVKSNQCQIHQWKWLPVCVASFFPTPPHLFALQNKLDFD